MSAAAPQELSRAPSPPRAAPRSVVPDLILGIAVAAVTLVPLTTGLSLALAPVAWIGAIVESRRRRRSGVLVGERIENARAVGAFLSFLVCGPVAIALLVGLVLLLTRRF